MCFLENVYAACETQVMLPTMNPTVRFVWFVGVVNVLSSMCAIMHIVENPNGMNSLCARNPLLSVDTVIGCFVEFEGKENRPKEKDTIQVQHS
jgi:hypothetical protein